MGSYPQPVVTSFTSAVSATTTLQFTPTALTWTVSATQIAQLIAAGLVSVSGPNYVVNQPITLIIPF
jgi:hypothetical protein